MNPDLYNCLSDELNKMRILQTRQEAKLKSLADYSGRTLLESRRGDYPFYYESYGPGRGRRYLGSGKNPEVQKIKTARHLQEVSSALRQNIELLENALEKYSDYDYETIEQLLPKAYRSATADTPAKKHMHRDAAKWLEEKNREKELYLQRYPDRYPSSRKVQRANGEWMRSRAEGMIADQLDLYGIPFVYELPHYCNGKWIKTDFTALSIRDYRTEKMIEHLGLMDSEGYRKEFADKVADYMTEGFMPNIDIFFTFENPDQTVSLVPVQSIIDRWLR